MIVALNNKSNFTREEYKEYLKEIEKIYFRGKLILCPTYLNLTVETDVLLGAQDVSPFEDGAHTGEISAKQLSSIGVKSKKSSKLASSRKLEHSVIIHSCNTLK